MVRNAVCSAILVQLAIMGAVLKDARAADFNAYAGAAVGQNSFSQSGPTSGLGWGTQVTVGLGEMVGAELGIIYVGEQSSYGTSSTNSITQNFLDVPLMLRVSPFRNFSLMGGAYYGWGVGPDRYYSTNGTVTSTSHANRRDYGQIAGASLQFPFHDHMRLRLESTYQHGTANISTGPYTEYSRVVSFWIGGQFDFDWKFFKPTVNR